MLIRIIITILKVVISKAFKFSPEQTPKATSQKYIGNHIENLAALSSVDIQPIEEIRNLNNLPVWISEDPNSTSPKIYNGLFWEIEPMGEYIYYLAGNFNKNEKGLLRYGTTTTSLFVEVNFEDDVINVAKADSQNEQLAAEKQKDSTDFVCSLTIEEFSQKIPLATHDYDNRVAFISLNKLLNSNSKGHARLILSKPNETNPDAFKPFLSLIYEEFFESTIETELPRYTKIKITSNISDIKIDDLVKEHLKLINKYSNMPYVNLSGTTRG